MSATDRDRLNKVLAAYGADPARWPEAERADLEREGSRGAQDSPELREAHEIDVVLATAPDIKIPEGAMDKVLELAQRSPSAEVIQFSPERRLSRTLLKRIQVREAVPIGIALAASLLVGVFAGFDEQVGSVVSVASLESSAPALEDELWSFDPFKMTEGEPL